MSTVFLVMLLDQEKNNMNSRKYKLLCTDGDITYTSFCINFSNGSLNTIGQIRAQNKKQKPGQNEENFTTSLY